LRGLHTSGEDTQLPPHPTGQTAPAARRRPLPGATVLAEVR
jgi:hypothetical protein